MDVWPRRQTLEYCCNPPHRIQSQSRRHSHQARTCKKLLYIHAPRLCSVLTSFVVALSQVLDVAEAMQRMMDAESTVGQTFSLAGPKTYSYNDIIRIAETHTLKKLGGFSVPKWMASATTRLWENVWWPTISPDEVVRRYLNDKEAAPGTLGFEYLDIKPDALEDVAIIYLRRYRSR